MSQLIEIIENASKHFSNIEIFNPKGKDLIFKGTELVRLFSTSVNPIEGLPEGEYITIYMTAKNTFIVFDSRKNEMEGPLVINDRHSLAFGFYGYDRVAKALYRLLTIDAYNYV